MSEIHREIAQLILRQLSAYFEGDGDALEDLGEGLQSLGVSAETVRESLEWLMVQAQGSTEELVPSRSGREPGLRVLSAEERESMTAEAYGYLLGLAADGRLRSDQFEAILSRLGESEDPVDLERMQEMTWEVALDGAESEYENGRSRFVH